MQPFEKSTASSRDTPHAQEVQEAERKIGAVLADLEDDTGGEVRDVDLDQVVDTDANGRPVLKKKVAVKFQPKQDRHWAR